jgi:hypothetical protein
MSLTQPVWTRLPRVGATAGNGKAWATGLAASFGSAVDFEGNARTPGVGVQWSVSSTHYDDPAANDGAVYVIPGAGSSASGGVIIGAAAGAPTPVMGLNNAFAASCPMIGSGIDVGGVVGLWSSNAVNQPLGAGKRFLGFSQLSSTMAAGLTWTDVWTCADAIFLAVKLAGVVHLGASHGLIDPRTSVYTPADEEADRRVYATATRGNSAAAQTTWDSSNVGGVMAHTAGAGGKCFCNTPGATPVVNLPLAHANWINTGVTLLLGNCARSKSGRYIGEEVGMHDTTDGSRLGTLRGIRIGWNGLHGQRVPAVGDLEGWLVGTSDTVAGLTWFLSA